MYASMPTGLAPEVMYDMCMYASMPTGLAPEVPDAIRCYQMLSDTARYCQTLSDVLRYYRMREDTPNTPLHIVSCVEAFFSHPLFSRFRSHLSPLSIPIPHLSSPHYRPPLTKALP